MAGIYRVEVDGNVNAAVKLRAVPTNVAKDLTSKLTKQVAPLVEKNIKKGMPVSSKTTTHMKYANSLKTFTVGGAKGFRNIGFYIQPQKDFWYMKFTNNGSGTSRKRTPLFFVQSGLSASMPTIKRAIDEIVSKSIKM